MTVSPMAEHAPSSMAPSPVCLQAEHTPTHSINLRAPDLFACAD